MINKIKQRLVVTLPYKINNSFKMISFSMKINRILIIIFKNIKTLIKTPFSPNVSLFAYYYREK